MIDSFFLCVICGEILMKSKCIIIVGVMTVFLSTVDSLECCCCLWKCNQFIKVIWSLTQIG